jgi:putative SOS response-associated peptidase YedK
MCRKYIPPNPKKIQRQMHYMFPKPILERDISPTDLAPMLGRSKDGSLSGNLGAFGIIGNWDGSGKATPLFNIRCETIIEKSTFKEAYAKRRCIIPAEGFYEEAKSRNDLHIFTRTDGQLLYFPGLWNWSADKQPQFAIVTMPPNETVAPYHNRMPMIIEDFEYWLDGADPLADIKTAPGHLITAHRVQ